MSYWIKNLAYNENNFNNGCLNLTDKIFQTKTFLKYNKDILILKADKSNKTVIMNKSEYNTKIENLLADDSTYIKLEKDPTSDIN